MLSEELVKALFLISGIEFQDILKVENKSWPKEYIEALAGSPWFLVKTPFGIIEIRQRKNTIFMDWSDTPYRTRVTVDNVLSSYSCVVAKDYPKAAEYLTVLSNFIKKVLKDEEEVE